MDKGILLKISESQILEIVSEMCDESLPPDLHQKWAEVRLCLVYTRPQLECLTLTVGEIVAEIKKNGSVFNT